MALSHCKKMRKVGCFLLMLLTSCNGQENTPISPWKPSETESFPSVIENPSLPPEVESSPSAAENLNASELDDQTHWGDIKF